MKKAREEFDTGYRHLDQIDDMLPLLSCLQLYRSSGSDPKLVCALISVHRHSGRLCQSFNDSGVSTFSACNYLYNQISYCAGPPSSDGCACCPLAIVTRSSSTTF